MFSLKYHFMYFIVATLFAVQSGMAGGSTVLPVRFQFPQTLAGEADPFDYITTVTLQNKGGDLCPIFVEYNQGAGVPTELPVLTNGENLGNFFSQTVPANGTLDLVVTLDGAGLFEGNVTIIYTPDPSCGALLCAKSAYGCRSSKTGRLVEVFSTLPAKTVPLGSCVSGPVNFDPDGADSTSNNPGLAFVGNPPSIPAPPGMEVTLQLVDTQGSVIDQTTLPLTGERKVGLLPNFFPDQGSFQGTFEVCPEGSARDFNLDTVMIEVLQSGSDVQLSTIPLKIKSLKCTPDQNTLCLNDDRFKVEVDWRDFSDSGPGLAMPQDDTFGIFYFLIRTAPTC